MNRLPVEDSEGINLPSKVLPKILVRSGILPLLYALSGVLLYYVFRLDLLYPSFYTVLYYAGAFLSVLFPFVLLFKNRPPKKSDFLPCPKESSYPATDLSPLFSEEYEKRKEGYPLCEKKEPKKASIYFSTLQPDILVHEYEDRFELYKVKGKKLISCGVEFK